jgi:crotonobetainyl-CoA:carnitine CoA-transferase CaiB-like acyl-CoA transferase
VRADFQGAFLARDRDAWTAELAPADTCVAPVHSIEELVNDPHLVGRGAFLEVVHPERGRFRQLAPLLAGASRPQAPVALRAARETDTAELLRAAGLSGAEIEKLEAEGFVA